MHKNARVLPSGRLVPGHCIIAPIAHCASSRAVDEDVWEEMRNFKKCLVKMFASQGKECCFIETVVKLGGGGAVGAAMSKHCVVECIPLPDHVGEHAPMYFKKARWFRSFIVTWVLLYHSPPTGYGPPPPPPLVTLFQASSHHHHHHHHQSFDPYVVCSINHHACALVNFFLTKYSQETFSTPITPRKSPTSVEYAPLDNNKKRKKKEKKEIERVNEPSK